MIHSRFPLVAAVASALLLPLTGYSLGSRIPDQDAEATARGGAFTATADNPSAIYYNPAGIMQMDGLTSLISGYGILIHEHYDPLKGDKVNHQTTNEQKLQGVPQSYYVYHPKGKPFAVGLGIYTPFGFSLEYPDNTSFRQEGLYGSVQFITVNPVLAVQVTRSLSIGIGVSVNYINAELRQGLTPNTGDLFSFKGDGFAVGANAGILWKPTPRQAIGLSYHSPVEGDLSGHTSAHLNGSELRASEAGNRQIAAGRQALAAGIQQINSLPIPPAQKQALIANANATFAAQLAAAGVPASGVFPTTFPRLGAKGSLPFPQYATLGYSFRPTPDWNLEADIDWTDWDTLNTLTIHQSDGSSIKIPFNWKHSFMYRLGASRMIHGYRVSAGYMYSENSVPTDSFSPVIPDSARDIFSLGVGHTFGSYSIDLAYQLSIGPKRTVVRNSIVDGRYSFLSNALTLSLGHQF